MTRYSRLALIVVGAAGALPGPLLAQHVGGALPADLQEKVQRVEAGVRNRPKDAPPPVGIVLAMHRFQASMAAGRPEEAKAAIDSALERVEGKADPYDQKLRKVLAGIKKLQESGEKAMILSLTMSQLGPRVEAGDENGVDETLGLALRLAAGVDPRKEKAALPFVRFAEKMKKVQELLPAWKAAGGEESKIADTAGRAGKLVESGKLAEAEAALDQGLAVLDSKDKPSAPAPGDEGRESK